MNRFKKIFTTGLVAATLGSSVLASTPASAWCNGWGCGGGWGGGWGGPSGGAVAAGVIGGMALGAMAAGAASSAYPGYYAYPAPAYRPRTCRTRSPVYDEWGNFVGYQRVYVAC